MLRSDAGREVGGRRGLASEVGGVNYEREYNICCCIKPPVMISGLRGRA